MKGKLVWSIFWALVGVLVIAAGMIFIPSVNRPLFGEESPTPLGFIFVISAGVIITGLGVTLLVLTAKAKEEKRLKVFLLLAEASLVGLPIFVILHNAVSGLMHFEEAVFFTLATTVCPLGVLVGAVGSLVFARKTKPGVLKETSRGG